MADCEQANYTLSQHIAELDEARQTAFAMGVPGAAVQAIISKGKALGYYTDRLRVETETDIPGLINQLRDAMGPEVANAFAAKLLGRSRATPMPRILVVSAPGPSASRPSARSECTANRAEYSKYCEAKSKKAPSTSSRDSASIRSSSAIAAV